MADKKSKRPSPSSMVGEKLFLRPATAEDVAGSYHWYLLSDPQSKSPKALSFFTPGEAASAFRERTRSTEEGRFMVIRKSDQTPVGWIDFLRLNPHNRSAGLRLIVDPDERNKGYGLETIRLICQYLFNDRGLNKVYTQIAEYDLGMKVLLEKAGFQRDGTLRRHYLHQGEFHDGIIYSLLQFEAKK